MHISEYVNPSKNNPSDLSDFCLSKKITEKADNETNRLIARLRLEALMHKSQAVKFVNLFGYENAYERLERAKFHYPSDESRVGRVLGGQMKKALKTKPEMMQKQDHIVIEENPDQEKNKHHDAINHVWNQLAPKAHRSEKIDVELAKSVMATIEAYPKADQHQRLDAKLRGKEITTLELYFAMKEVIEAENEDIDTKDDLSHPDHFTRPEFGHDADKDNGKNRSTESITKTITASSSASMKLSTSEKLRDKLLATVTEKLESRRANENFGGIKSIGGINNNEFGGLKSEVGGLNGGIKAKNGGLKLGEKSNKLLNVVKKHPGHRVKFYAEKLECSVRSVERMLHELRDANIIEYRGCKKTGGYHVIM
jgi:predicted NAD-dependent protein-ADP-ribosyltransferase YbiA (DUF1768 family)